MSTTVTGIEREPFKYFDLAFLGYNYELTKFGLRQFVKNNSQDIEKINWGQSIVYLKDGTTIKGLIFSQPDELRGYRFDQLILFDDDRWLIHGARWKEIYEIQRHTMHCSNVPEEFQILHYEDVRES